MSADSPYISSLNKCRFFKCGCQIEIIILCTCFITIGKQVSKLAFIEACYPDIKAHFL